jgi:hypothetical protein
MVRVLVFVPPPQDSVQTQFSSFQSLISQSTGHWSLLHEENWDVAGQGLPPCLGAVVICLCCSMLPPPQVVLHSPASDHSPTTQSMGQSISHSSLAWVSGHT